MSLVGDIMHQEDVAATDLKRIPQRFALLHADVVHKLSMPFPRREDTVQQETDRDTHAVILGTTHRRIDMRTLEMDMSRATHTQHGRVATPEDEKRVLGLVTPTPADTNAMQSG